MQGCTAHLAVHRGGNERLARAELHARDRRDVHASLLEKLQPADAQEVMKELGTAKVAARFAAMDEYFRDRGARVFGRNEVLDIPKLRAYYGKSKSALKSLYENAKRRGEAAAKAVAVKGLD